jgi:diguanylate cyclase (GGDEF)-like protein
MRALRQRCDNHAELEQAYAAQVGNLNFATTLNWVMGERTFEVDTHPVRGDGEQGRIWLFTDSTADLLMAAELRRLASSDPLTGVPNRRHFEERSAQIIAAREATGRSVAVLMLDVDHFKKINDTHGHPIGDEVLKVVARRCREALRERDLFARFGGEEFIALLAAPTADEVPATAERLRNAISGAPVHVGGLRIEVTVSVGGAMGEALPGSDARLLEQLVARADEALYQAKADGRNRVRMSG